jgi:hypothetical protein
MVGVVTFPVEALSAVVEERAGIWEMLGLRRQVSPVQPNHGKAVVNAQLESSVWGQRRGRTGDRPADR